MGETAARQETDEKFINIGDDVYTKLRDAVFQLTTALRGHSKAEYAKTHDIEKLFDTPVIPGAVVVTSVLDDRNTLVLFAPGVSLESQSRILNHLRTGAFEVATIAADHLPPTEKLERV
jgi:hypothetical protein